MIISTKPLSLAEVRSLATNLEEKKSFNEYLKKFCALDIAAGNKLNNELHALNNLKIKEEHIVKVIDILPRDAEDVHKIFSDVSLDEEEVNAILGIVAKY